MSAHRQRTIRPGCIPANDAESQTRAHPRRENRACECSDLVAFRQYSRPGRRGHCRIDLHPHELPPYLSPRAYPFDDLLAQITALCKRNRAHLPGLLRKGRIEEVLRMPDNSIFHSHRLGILG